MDSETRKLYKQEYFKNPDNRKKQREYDKRWAQNHPEIKKRINRRVTLKRHGVTIDWYEEQLEKQGGTCAYPPCLSERDTKRRLNVDHDHETGKVRGLLCNYHNTRIVDIKFHEWAIDYIKSHMAIAAEDRRNAKKLAKTN